MIAEISVSAGYPANGLYKLYIRQCKCELELGRSVTTKVVVICSYFSSIVLLAFFLSFFSLVLSCPLQRCPTLRWKIGENIKIKVKNLKENFKQEKTPIVSLHLCQLDFK